MVCASVWIFLFGLVLLFDVLVVMYLYDWLVDLVFFVSDIKYGWNIEGYCGTKVQALIKECVSFSYGM